MKNSLCVTLPLVFVLPSCILAFAQSSADQSLAGEWQLTTIELKIASTERLLLAVSGDQVSGTLSRDSEKIAVTGTAEGKSLHLEFKDGDEQNVYVGTLNNGTMSGTYTTTGKDEKVSGEWNARRAPTDKPAQSRTLDLKPTEFQRALSANVPPVMRIWPGDLVHTTSVDAGGQDEKSVKRVTGGNPLTGPFYIEGAMPGDVLAVTIKRLRINRDWAESDNGLVSRALTTNYASNNKQTWDNVRWHLDADKQVATLENAPAALKAFSVPLHPMLGCVGVAPGPYGPPVSTQDSGDLGGNMDFNGVSEGATVFLQVNEPGALLYVGDAHARQGDGELNGNALETSMDIEFTVAVERDKSIDTPRVENDDYIMTMGLSGSLDNAFRIATSGLAKWLQADYKLTAGEAAMVLGTSIEYNISEVADRNVGVVAKMRKSALTLPEPTTLAELDERLTLDCEAGRFSGVVIARKAGEIVFRHICGLADVASHEPITLRTRFKIFSVSKTFTGTLVMMLADRHLIKLDDPARKYLPEMPVEWSGITIRQLLNHTSGTPDLTEKLLKAYQANPSGGYDGAMHSVLAGASAEDKAIKGTPGSEFVYDNFGFELLARVIENVSHASYEKVITEKILKPAHMDSAEIAKPLIVDGKLVGSQASPGLAQGYNGKPGVLEPANSFQFVQMGAGAIYASPQDLFNFDSALSNGKLVSGNIVTDCSLHAFAISPTVSYGCGWMDKKIGDEPYFQHDGGSNGFVTDFARDPREDVTVVLMSNLGFVDPSDIRHALMTILLTPSTQTR